MSARLSMTPAESAIVFKSLTMLEIKQDVVAALADSPLDVSLRV